MATYIGNRKFTEIIPEKVNNPALGVLSNDNSEKESGFFVDLK
jgi:hypothetical protein